MTKVKAKKKKTVKKKKSRKAFLDPLGRLVVQRINKHGKTRGGIIDTRMHLEETPYAVVYEPGENDKFSRGELVMVHAHCGHDFTYKTKDKKGEDISLSLTIIEPEDIIARVEGSPAEIDKFIDDAKYQL